MGTLFPNKMPQPRKMLPAEQGTNLPMPPGNLPRARMRGLTNRHPCRISIPSETGTEEIEIGAVCTLMRPNHFFTEQPVSRPLLKQNQNIQVRNPMMTEIPRINGPVQRTQKEENLHSTPTLHSQAATSDSRIETPVT